MDDPNLKGNAAEFAIAEASTLGLTVLKPLTEHERYDLVLGIGGELLRTPMQVGVAAGRGHPDRYLRMQALAVTGLRAKHIQPRRD